LQARVGVRSNEIGIEPSMLPGGTPVGCAESHDETTADFGGVTGNSAASLTVVFVPKDAPEQRPVRIESGETLFLCLVLSLQFKRLRGNRQ